MIAVLFDTEHREDIDLEAQKKGREEFYRSSWVQVCKTIREQEDQYL